MTIPLKYSDITWAWVVSHVLSPPIVWAALVCVIAFHAAESRGQALLWSAAYGVFVCLLPGLYIVWLVRRGSGLRPEHARDRVLSGLRTAAPPALSRVIPPRLGLPGRSSRLIPPQGHRLSDARASLEPVASLLGG